MGNNEKPTPVLLKDVHYSPNMAFTIVSVSRMDHTGLGLLIQGGNCVIRSPGPNPKVVGRIPETRGLYRISENTRSPDCQPATYAAMKVLSISQLHRKMGHINHDDLREMVIKGMVSGIELDKDSKPEFCDVCVKSKATRRPFSKESTTEYKTYGDKVVSDLWGPAKVMSLGGNKYANTYIDAHTREERAYYLPSKSDAFAAYKKYEAWVRVQCGTPIKIFGCDRGGEFMSHEFTEHLENSGTVRHLTVHNSPASNGAAE